MTDLGLTPERVAAYRRAVDQGDYVEVWSQDLRVLLDAYEEGVSRAAPRLERREVVTLLQIIGATELNDSPAGKHLAARLRALVGLTGNERYCAQCSFNGMGWFEIPEGGECPNPKCVLKNYLPRQPDAGAPATPEKGNAR